MTLTQMNYIITISETGSLNKAAEALYISQPSLTNAVKELEKELGIIIFNRSGRGVTLTNDGTEFLMYARQIYGQYESVVEKYSEGGSYKKKFGVSTQHYSFAVKAFVDMVQKFDVSEYEFAIRETKTADVISDVSTMKSEVGVLYLSDFNRKALLKLLHSANLEFHHLIDCQHMYICGKIIHWQMRNPSATASWQNTPACPSNREIRAVFICQRRFCLPMNIPEQLRLQIVQLC